MAQKYIDIIKNPPEETKGYTRWWWYGCAVTKKGIKKQLTDIKDAGMGGVEIQILYPVSPDNKSLGVKNIPYFSPEFFEIIEYTANTCEEMSLKFDFTLGSSWPYGGPFVKEEHAMQYVVPYQIDVHGPMQYKSDLTTRIVGDVCAAALGKMQNSVMKKDTLSDITDKFVIKELFSWPWGTETKAIDIPDGDWKLVFFVLQRYRQVVRRPTLNAEGYVIDHCSDEALDSFLENMAQPIVDRLGKGKINAFFCDSLECDGHNWSGKLLSEFRKRRGYDLTKYIYALWGDIGENTGDVRYDYFLTMSELTVENFFQRLTDWGNSNNSKVRIQAHGTWGDILKCYAACDIPEGETFGDHVKVGCNTIHRRLAVSAGHVYGRDIISNETFTWLKVPRFIATLEDMKKAVDAVFLDGMNMIVNHGFSYIPDDAEDRGWPFYASTHISTTNTWWKYYHHLAEYIQRASALLRMGKHYSEIAIYLPQADVWSDNVLSDIHMSMKLEEHIGREVANKINKAGYWFDYINDEALTDLGKVEDGGIKIGENTYIAIILIGCDRLPVDTAKALDSFVRNGGTLLSTEGRPTRSCGLLDIENKTAVVDDIMSTLFTGNGWNSVQSGKAIATKDREDDLITRLGEAIKPDLAIDKNDEIGYVHRVDGENDIYFTSNISSTATTAKLVFSNVASGFTILDVETGDEVFAKGYELGAELVIEMIYKAMQTLVFVFNENIKLTDTKLSVPMKQTSELVINSWTLSVPEKEFVVKTDKGETWEQYDELKYFSGEGVYESSFVYCDEVSEYDHVYLELDNIYCAGEVYINDAYCGDIWKAPYRVDIKSAIINGTNNIKIKTVNTLINEAIDPSKKDEIKPTIIDEWPYFGNVINNLRDRIFFNHKERKEIKSPQPSGLSGDVKIVFVKY